MIFLSRVQQITKCLTNGSESDFHVGKVKISKTSNAKKISFTKTEKMQ